MYKHMGSESVFELMLIASNYEDGLRQEAVDQANLILSSKYHNIINDFKTLWHESTQVILEKDKNCSICNSRDIEYSEDIYFCTEEVKNIDEEGDIVLPEFIPEIISDGGIGTQYTRKGAGYKYAKGKFKLCHNCVESHKNNKQNKLIINLGECYLHPMYQYYEALGFNRIKPILQ